MEQDIKTSKYQASTFTMTINLLQSTQLTLSIVDSSAKNSQKKIFTKTFTKQTLPSNITYLMPAGFIQDMKDLYNILDSVKQSVKWSLASTTLVFAFTFCNKNKDTYFVLDQLVKQDASVQQMCQKMNYKFQLNQDKSLAPSQQSIIGVLQKPNGKYEGDIVNGKMHGNGKFYYLNGDIYQGSFKNNLFDGKGKTFKSGNIVQSYYYNGKNHGKFKCSYASGIICEGFYKHGVIDGPGKFILKNGQEIIGIFKNNKMIGNGTQFFLNGDIYQGQFLNQKFHGFGTYYFANGLIFEGYFKNGQQQGTGKYYYKSGDIAKVELKGPKKHGIQEYIKKSGQIIYRYWNEGNQITLQQWKQINKSSQAMPNQIQN